MSPNAESPVQTQVAIPVPEGVLRRGKHKNWNISRRHSACRRVFVQTDTGCVIGIELDEADNVQTVKKKMQSMLNVPTDQTALVFGDTVLKNDLSELRNDAPLLLTRGLQRSISTPCFSPAYDSHIHVDSSQPLEIVGGLKCCSKIKCLIKEMAKAIECRVAPMPVSGGLGGAYYFRNVRGESIAIVKPTDEEPFAPNNPKGLIGKMLGQPGLKRAVRVGETGVREVAAYLLDHDHFAGVPPTVLVKVAHEVFHVSNASHILKVIAKALPVAKLASCQQFVPHDFDASELGTSRFPVSAVHRIGILDVRIFNTDRHGGNILVKKLYGTDKQGSWGYSHIQLDESLELIPIDHGLCLPESLEDPYFEWLHWPQASLPFSEDELDYINRLDVAKDIEMLRVELPMLREACLRMLAISTTLLKKAAAAGLCLAEIGEMMSRDSCGMEEASELEVLCIRAKLAVDQKLSTVIADINGSISEHYFSEELPGEQFQFFMDQEEESSVNREVNIAKISHDKHAVPCLCSRCRDLGEQIVSTSGCRVPVENGATCTSMMTTAANVKQPLSSCTSKSGNRSFLSSILSSGARNLNGAFSRLGVLHEVSSLEEEALTSGMDTLTRNMKYHPLINVASQAQSFRSVSFNERRQRCPAHFAIRSLCSQGFSASGIRGKAVCSDQLLLTDMSDEEWTVFIVFFEDLLEDTLMNWQRKNTRQRLGISCQF
eukprot:c28254_g1_i1 orf=866-3013(+)